MKTIVVEARKNVMETDVKEMVKNFAEAKRNWNAEEMVSLTDKMESLLAEYRVLLDRNGMLELETYKKEVSFYESILTEMMEATSKCINIKNMLIHNFAEMV